MSSFALSDRSMRHRRGVDPSLVEISDLAIKLTPVDFGIPETGGVRTAEVQFELHRMGRSKADGYKIKSDHQVADDGFGKALDFYAYVDGKASWDKHYLAVVAAAHLQAASILGYQLEWGGLWSSFPDYPHLKLMGE